MQINLNWYNICLLLFAAQRGHTTLKTLIKSKSEKA